MTKEFLAVARVSELFKDIAPEELQAMFGCLGAEVRTAARGEILLLAGEKPQTVGMVLTGRLHVLREDAQGRRSLIAALTPGELFAEALCCAGIAESPVTVLAEADSVVLQMRFSRILHTCPKACTHHTKLIGNMLGLIAKKNLFLQSRMEILSLKSIRAKVLRFLESFLSGKGRAGTVPFNREGMADYLCVDRSALSHALIRMKEEGLIDYKKNQFLLK